MHEGMDTTQALEKLLDYIYAPLYGLVGTDRWGLNGKLTARRCPQKESAVINGVWINVALLLYNSERINRRGRSTASGQTTCSVLLECDWEGAREGRRGESSVHIFHVHQHPSRGCSAESSFVCLWVVGGLKWYTSVFCCFFDIMVNIFNGKFMFNLVDSSPVWRRISDREVGLKTATKP